jgi:hypothetical protein
VAFGALATGAFLTALDSLYCSYVSEPPGLQLVITPWNAIEYHRKPVNLPGFGLHSQYYYLLVNLPLLFGLQGIQGLWKALSTQAALLRMWNPSGEKSSLFLSNSGWSSAMSVLLLIWSQSVHERSFTPWLRCPLYPAKSLASWSLWSCR